MDIGRSCTDAYNTLKSRPSLILPVLLASLLTLVAGLYVLEDTGLRGLMIEYNSLSMQYDQENPLDTSSTSFIERAQAKDKREAALNNYLEEHGWFAKFDVIFTKENILKLLGFFIFAALAWFYSMTALFIGVKDLLTGQGLHWPGVLGETTRRFIPSVFAWIIVPLFIVLTPLVLIVVLIILAAQVHPILSILVAILGAIGGIAWIVFALVKLTLVSGTFFVDGKGALIATKESWHKSKGRFWNTALLLLVFCALALIPTQLSNGLSSYAIIYYFSDSASSGLAVMIALGVFNGIVYSLANTYAALFFCHAYLKIDEK